jgi:hypothetical protein
MKNSRYNEIYDEYGYDNERQVYDHAALIKTVSAVLQQKLVDFLDAEAHTAKIKMVDSNNILLMNYDLVSRAYTIRELATFIHEYYIRKSCKISHWLKVEKETA